MRIAIAPRRLLLAGGRKTRVDLIAGDAGLPMRVQHRIAPRVERLSEETGFDVGSELKSQSAIGESLLEPAPDVVRVFAFEVMLHPQP